MINITNRYRRVGWVGMILAIAAVGACAQPANDARADATQQAPSAEAAVVMAYTAAFNAHDAQAMRALMSDDIEWLSIVADSVVIEAVGADALMDGMVAYFEDFPDVHSEVVTGDGVGAYVHAHETATWSRAGVTSSQSSLSTYEVRNGKVARVWYFPSGS